MIGKRGRDVVFSSRRETAAEMRAELVGRAVENIVRNAVKATVPGAAVMVTAGPDEDRRTLSSAPPTAAPRPAMA